MHRLRVASIEAIAIPRRRCVTKRAEENEREKEAEKAVKNDCYFGYIEKFFEFHFFSLPKSGYSRFYVQVFLVPLFFPVFFSVSGAFFVLLGPSIDACTEIDKKSKG